MKKEIYYFSDGTYRHESGVYFSADKKIYPTLEKIIEILQTGYSYEDLTVHEKQIFSESKYIDESLKDNPILHSKYLHLLRKCKPTEYISDSEEVNGFIENMYDLIALSTKDIKSNLDLIWENQNEESGDGSFNNENWEYCRDFLTLLKKIAEMRKP
jgi:hypothetical protein